MEAIDTVGELLTLQEIDLEIHRITSQLDQYDRELAGLREARDELEARASKISGEKDRGRGTRPAGSSARFRRAARP